MPNKMTDNEIIKALPKVLYGGHGCKNCKYDNGKGDDRCGLKGCKIARYALDLINRQKAEIERLKEPKSASAIHTLAESAIEAENRLPKFIQDIKAEAAKEFAERLCEGRVSNDPVVIAVKTELKEMEGD